MIPALATKFQKIGLNAIAATATVISQQFKYSSTFHGLIFRINQREKFLKEDIPGVYP
jgi:hypothetical protein